MMARKAYALLLAAGIALAGAAAHAGEFAVVTTRVVYPGEIVSGDLLQEVTLNRANRDLSAFLLASSMVEGKVARRTLRPGRLIQADALREPYLVETGKAVEARFVSGALTITATVVPLQSGSAGDLIKVRNADSGRVFSGIVMADGSIRVSAS
jgi:flagella basal body P-ring formation protein FlgA